MELQRFAVLGFATTHDALSAEAALLAAGVRVTPVPTPAALGALCGIAMRLPLAEEPAARAALEACDIGITAAIELDDIVPS